MAANSQPSGWVGWVYFAGMLMLILGFFSIFRGILALVKHTAYVVTPDSLIVFNYTSWGWTHIVLGIILLTAAGSAMSGRWWGRIIGAVVAALALLENLVLLPAYPIWSITAVIISGFVLYALLVRGGEARIDS
jgi:hypothetical protein